MAEVAKLTPLTEKSWVALNAMRQVEGGITLTELNESFNIQVASANMSQLIRRGLVNAEKTQFECPTCGSKSVKNVYTLTDAGAVYQDAE